MRKMVFIVSGLLWVLLMLGIIWYWPTFLVALALSGVGLGISMYLLQHKH